MKNLGMIRFLNGILEFFKLDNPSKGTVVLLLLLVDAFAFVFSLMGKSKDATVTSWPLFWFSIALLFFIVWYSTN